MPFSYSCSFYLFFHLFTGFINILLIRWIFGCLLLLILVSFMFHLFWVMPHECWGRLTLSATLALKCSRLCGIIYSYMYVLNTPFFGFIRCFRFQTSELVTCLDCKLFLSICKINSQSWWWNCAGFYVVFVWKVFVYFWYKHECHSKRCLPVLWYCQRSREVINSGVHRVCNDRYSP